MIADIQDLDTNMDKFIVRYLHPDEHEIDLTENIDRVKDLLDLVILWFLYVPTFIHITLISKFRILI